jgi:hypothetical protein
VTKIINTTLKKVLDKQKYDAEKVPELIKTIANEILAEIKSMTLLL